MNNTLLEKAEHLMQMHRQGLLGGDVMPEDANPDFKAFPYLSGVKICNYWLYVIHQYTDRKFQRLDALTVAPDTHVCKASVQLGLITEEEYNSPNVQKIVIEAWRELFKGTEYKPIDIHTPLWLWSRNGFKEVL